MLAAAIAHIMPTVAVAAARKPAALKAGPQPAGPSLLTYHDGRVMSGIIEIYNILWAPPTLQNGAATGISHNYRLIQNMNAAYLPGHGILNIATQYYEMTKTTTTYIQNIGFLAGHTTDTSPYPASGCIDSTTPGNCVDGGQII